MCAAVYSAAIAGSGERQRVAITVPRGHRQMVEGEVRWEGRISGGVCEILRGLRVEGGWGGGGPCVFAWVSGRARRTYIEQQ